MKYATPQALRAALTSVARRHAREHGLAPGDLVDRFYFQRLLDGRSFSLLWVFFGFILASYQVGSDSSPTPRTLHNPARLIPASLTGLPEPFHVAISTPWMRNTA